MTRKCAPFLTTGLPTQGGFGGSADSDHGRGEGAAPHTGWRGFWDAGRLLILGGGSMAVAFIKTVQFMFHAFSSIDVPLSIER